jgi:hypothetical protein
MRCKSRKVENGRVYGSDKISIIIILSFTKAYINLFSCEGGIKKP